ncbi:hypothetical protein AB0P15_25530 [Streptomyces sp. NPDC087917]|uniref:hypothetical protein n=1 Tax=unclassified Streptomyces TaxID=2593676 RepID=UPI00342B7BE7
MSATTHTPSRTAAPTAAGFTAAAHGSRRRTAGADGTNARLHWWTLALPALAFGLLLLLLAGSGTADAATADRPSGQSSGLVHVTQQLLRAVG